MLTNELWNKLPRWFIRNIVYLFLDSCHVKFKMSRPLSLTGPHDISCNINNSTYINIESKNYKFIYPELRPFFGFQLKYFTQKIIYFMQENYCQLKIRPFKRTRKGMEPAINKFQLHTKTLTSVFQCNRPKFLPTTL